MDAPARTPTRAVLFDLDGVLVHSDPVWFRLLNQAAEVWGYPPISERTFLSATGQGIEADQARFYPDHGIPEIEAFYHAHFMEHVVHLEIAEGVAEVFQALRERGVATAVITNTPNPLAREVVAHARATPDTVVGGTDVTAAKPAPDMVFEACARLSVEAPEAWVVGDSRFDEAAARAAGCRFAGIGGIEGDVTLAALRELLRHV